MKAILVYTEVDAQYAALLHQEATVFTSESAAWNFMKQWFDRVYDEIGGEYGIVGWYDYDGAEIKSAKQNRKYYWKILPAL